MEKNLWEQVGNKCLNKADEILQTQTVLNSEQVKTVRELVDTAIAIDLLNLRWDQQNRFGAAAFRDQPFSRPKAKN